MQKESNLPIKPTLKSSSFDLFTDEHGIIPPHSQKFISTGIKIKFPHNFFGRISGVLSLATKGVDVFPQNIDNDFDSYLKVLVRNNNCESYRFFKGLRIAKLSIEKIV